MYINISDTKTLTVTRNIFLEKHFEIKVSIIEGKAYFIEQERIENRELSLQINH